MGMAYLRAWAEVRDTPVEELQDRLRDALEREHEIAHALECEPRKILTKIEDLRTEIRDAEDAKDEAEQEAGEFEVERDEAREKLNELKAKLLELT
jgi:chromosome segregation ATPase